jgi:hypothetical protein
MERRGPLGGSRHLHGDESFGNTHHVHIQLSRLFGFLSTAPRKSLFSPISPRHHPRRGCRAPLTASSEDFFNPGRCSLRTGTARTCLFAFDWGSCRGLVWEARAPVFIAMGLMSPTLELVFSALHSVTVCVYPFFPPWRLVLRADHERLAACRRFCSGRYTIACMFCVVPFFLPNRVF